LVGWFRATNRKFALFKKKLEVLSSDWLSDSSNAFFNVTLGLQLFHFCASYLLSQEQEFVVKGCTVHKHTDTNCSQQVQYKEGQK